jgi:hypothetical protein
LVAGQCRRPSRFSLADAHAIRSKCPGQHLIESSLWLLLASLLHTLDIEPETDDDGKPVDIAPTYENPVFRTPGEFPVVLRARASSVSMLAANDDEDDDAVAPAPAPGVLA